MKYITGIQALNLPCSLETCGDWHTSALQWSNLNVEETENSVFKEWGIEDCSCVPEHTGTFKIANTLRALLDLLVAGQFSLAQGMNEDFICNSAYDDEVFEKVSMLKTLSNWEQIDSFMGKEYKMKWLTYKERITHE